MSFKLDDKVEIIGTKLYGVIKGKSEYSNDFPENFWVFYTDAQGNPCDRWFTSDLICKKDY